MKDFYALAKELRQALRELYPNGYAKVIENETGVIVRITNFQPVPVTITRLEFTNTGTATIKSK